VDDVFAGQSVAVQYANYTDPEGLSDAIPVSRCVSLVPDVQIHGRQAMEAAVEVRCQLRHALSRRGLVIDKTWR
jgi:hypothetical protein